jgi:hypothetical protein
MMGRKFRLTPQQARDLELSMYETTIKSCAQQAQEAVVAQICNGCQLSGRCIGFCPPARSEIQRLTFACCYAKALEN